MTLNQIWQQYDLQNVDFINIDVEGYERRVLEGIDLTNIVLLYLLLKLLWLVHGLLAMINGNIYC